MGERLTSTEDVMRYMKSLNGKFTRETLHAVELAAQVGWVVVVTSADSISLISPVNDAKRIHISARKPIPPHRMVRQITRWGDPEKVDQMNNLTVRALSGDQKAKDELNKDVETEVLFMPPEAEPAKPRHEKPAPKPEPPKAAPKKERHIVSERPHLMHYNIGKGGGRSYPSKTTLERRWSDGTVDYVCAVPTCDKTSDNHLSFRGAHWAMHVRKGEAQPVSKEEMRASVIEDPSYTEHAWTRNAASHVKRVDALTQMLKGVDLSKISAADLAEMIVEFLGDTGGGGGGNGEPLTDAEIIDRIRQMVDRGTYADQERAILDRDRQIEDLMSYSEEREQELRQKLLIAEQQATAAQAKWEALRDLINDDKQ